MIDEVSLRSEVAEVRSRQISSHLPDLPRHVGDPLNHGVVLLPHLVYDALQPHLDGVLALEIPKVDLTIVHVDPCQRLPFSFGVVELVE